MIKLKSKKLILFLISSRSIRKNKLEAKGSLGSSKFQGYVQKQNEMFKVVQLQNLMKNIDDIGNWLERP